MKRTRFWFICGCLLLASACGGGSDDIPTANYNVVAAFQTMNNEIMTTIDQIDPAASALTFQNLQLMAIADSVDCTFGGTIDVSGDFTRSDDENANFALEMDYGDCGTRFINGKTGITGTLTGMRPQTVLDYSFGGVPGTTNVVTIVFSPNNSNCTITLAGLEVTDTTVMDSNDQPVTSCEVSGVIDADCNISGSPAVVDCEWNQLDCFDFPLLAQDHCSCNGSGCM